MIVVSQSHLRFVISNFGSESRLQLVVTPVIQSTVTPQARSTTSGLPVNLPKLFPEYYNMPALADSDA